jgi:hypothetical protein
MGQNKRYPELLEGDIARVEATIERWPQPIGLTDTELRGGGIRQDARDPVPVAAWIPHRVTYSDPQLVQGEAIAWTRTAVLVRRKTPQSVHPHHTWVWASAVTKLESQ